MVIRQGEKMIQKSSTLKSKQRSRVLDAYRARGRKNNSLWLVYSIKTKRDWLLTSDRQLVHWLVFLEAEPSVKDFNIEIDGDDSKNSVYVTVAYVHGGNEKHIIGGMRTSGLLHGATDIGMATETARFFTDEELKPKVPIAMRWHKALAYASVLRDYEHLPMRLALIPILTSLQSGTLREILDNSLEFDQALVIGMFVRIAVEGFIEIDLTRHGIAFKTQWCLSERFTHVESE